MLRRSLLLLAIALSGCVAAPLEWNEFRSANGTLAVSIPPSIDNLDAVNLPLISGDEKNRAVEAYSKGNLEQQYFMVGWVEPRRISGTLFTSAVGDLMKREETQRAITDYIRQTTPELLSCSLTDNKSAVWNKEPVLVRSGNCEFLKTQRKVEVRISPRGNVYLIAIAKADSQEVIEQYFSSVRFTPPASASEPAPDAREELQKKGNETLEWLRKRLDEAQQQ